MHIEPNEIENEGIATAKEYLYKAKEKLEQVFCMNHKDCEKCPINIKGITTKHCPFEHATFAYNGLLDILYKQARREIARNEKNEEEKK